MVRCAFFFFFFFLTVVGEAVARVSTERKTNRTAPGYTSSSDKLIQNTSSEKKNPKTSSNSIAT